MRGRMRAPTTRDVTTNSAQGMTGFVAAAIKRRSRLFDDAHRAGFAHRLVAVAQTGGLEIRPRVLRAGGADRAEVDAVGLGRHSLIAAVCGLEEYHQTEVGLDDLARIAASGLQFGAEAGKRQYRGSAQSGCPDRPNHFVRQHGSAPVSSSVGTMTEPLWPLVAPRPKKVHQLF